MSFEIRFSSAPRIDAEELDDMKAPFRKGAMVAVIGMITTIALAIIGIALTASGYLGGGITLLVLSLPLGYLSYNIYRVCSNTIDGLDNYREYLKGDDIDRQKIKIKASRGTICFDFAVDYLISKMT